jgi:hypothetical protein
MTDPDYERHERIAIKMDSGTSEAEAERQTAAEMGLSADMIRRGYGRAVEAPVSVAHPGPSQGRMF